MTLAARRVRFNTSRAVELAEAVGGPKTPFETTARLSRRFAFFADDDRLLVVAGGQEDEPGTGLALAYGLAHAGDRDLGLVLPRPRAAATLVRAPWIATPLRVWTHTRTDVREEVLRAPAEVLRSRMYRNELVTSEHELGEDRAPWIAELLDWAEHDPELTEAHRSGYLAWHCRGRLVLKVERTRAGLRVSAGVHTRTPEGPRQLVKQDLTGPASAAAVRRLVSAAAWAAADRLDGTDDRHAEHRFQAVLGRHQRLLGLQLVREFPAIRANGQRGFIDFLGVDAHGGLHVVETKLGGDEVLVLQGLDYWIWTCAHAAELAAHLDLPTDRPRVHLDFVVGDQDPPISPYTASQAEALDGAIPWRFHLVASWQDGTPQIHPLPRRTAPPAPRVAGPRHEARLQEHLLGHATADLDGVFHVEPLDGITAGAHAAYADLVARNATHRMIAHVRSSQAFALNLFAPLDAQGALEVLRLLVPDAVSAEAPVFEYSDPADRLGERTDRRPHQTQVDVVVRGVLRDGRRAMALIEVKLSEMDFGCCSAYLEPHNPTRAVCRQDGAFGGDPQACWQLANRGAAHRRRYDLALAPLDAIPASGAGCVFRRGANQPMRNVALARALLADGEVDVAATALCAPRGHPTIWRRWAEAKALFAGLTDVTMHDLPAEEIVTLLPATETGAVADRYGLAPDPASPTEGLTISPGGFFTVPAEAVEGPDRMKADRSPSRRPIAP